MTPEQFAAIEARANAATEGPWTAETTGVAGGDHWYVCDEGEAIASISCNDGTNEDQREPDAEFIAHSRTDIPALLVAVRERDNTIARIREVLDDYDGLNAEPIPKLSTHTWMHEVRAALDPQETP